MKKQPKAHELAKMWAKLYCKKGEVVEVINTPTVFMIRKLSDTEKSPLGFRFAYKFNDSKK